MILDADWSYKNIKFLEKIWIWSKQNVKKFSEIIWDKKLFVSKISLRPVYFKSISNKNWLSESYLNFLSKFPKILLFSESLNIIVLPLEILSDE